MSDNKKLPQPFQHLDGYVDYWVCESLQERWDRRCEAPMSAIEDFYRDVLSSAEDIMAYLDQCDVNDLSGENKNLMLLMLALANVAMAVELHQQPRAPFSPWPHGIRVVQGPQPFSG